MPSGKLHHLKVLYFTTVNGQFHQRAHSMPSLSWENSCATCSTTIKWNAYRSARRWSSCTTISNSCVCALVRM